MQGFEDISSKGPIFKQFLLKGDIFWTHQDELCAKNYQNLMRGFLDMALRTNERTNERA